MNPIDEKNLDTAIALGSAVCKELGVCCDERGRVIFHIYRKLQELKSEQSATTDAQGTDSVTDIVTGTVTPAGIGTGTGPGPRATARAAADSADSGKPVWNIKT